MSKRFNNPSQSYDSYRDDGKKDFDEDVDVNQRLMK